MINVPTGERLEFCLVAVLAHHKEAQRVNLPAANNMYHADHRTKCE